MNPIITDSKAVFKVKQGNRSFDDNGYLCINNCVLTAAEVNDYLGKEISGWQQLSLDPNKAYGIYRPLEELQKSVDTYNLIPLTDNHIAISPEKPAREKWFGSAGESSRIEGNELLNTVKVWVGKAIQEIQAADNNPEQGRKDLSCGYGYDLVQEVGEFNGKQYQFKMVNIKANHVALVDDGRVSTAMIADSASINNQGVKKMGFSIAKLLGRFLANDKKMLLDAAEKEEAEKGLKDEIKALAKDIGMAVGGGSDPEANENEQIKKLTQAVMTLHAIQSAEGDDAEPEEKDCNDVDPEVKASSYSEKDKDAKDVEKDAEDDEDDSEAEDDEKDEKEKEKAMDAAISKAVVAHMSRHNKVIGLCQNAIGKLSSDILMDADTDSLASKVLKIKGVACDSRTLAEKIVMLETLNQTRVKPQVAADKKAVASAVTYKSNVIRR
jgi:hypothetical protein